MCAIVDANVAGEVFGRNKTEAGGAFFNWLNKGQGRLVVGGELGRELNLNADFKTWAQQAAQSGKVTAVVKERVDRATSKLRTAGQCHSNDYHVIALAQISGARLLYSNDKQLQADFTDPNLVRDPRGRVYTTVEHSDIRASHRDLLRRNDLCRPAQ